MATPLKVSFAVALATCFVGFCLGTDVRFMRQEAGITISVVAYRPYVFSAPPTSITPGLRAKARERGIEPGIVAMTYWGLYGTTLVWPGLDGNCSVGPSVVLVWSVYEWPHWRPDAGTDPDAREAWAISEGRILEHEEGHGEIARFSASQALMGLIGVARGSCGALMGTGRQAFDAAVEVADCVHDEFDRRGDHRGPLTGVEALWADCKP
jgi:hypothetical protein